MAADISSHGTSANAYGPTEATVTATTFEVTATAGTPTGRIPIGRPLAGQQGLCVGCWAGAGAYWGVR